MKNIPWFSRWQVPTGLVLVVLTAIWAVFLKKPLGRDNWYLTPHGVWPFQFWLFPFLVLLVCGVFVWVCAFDRFRRAKSPKEARTSTRMALGGLCVLAIVWPWSLLGPLGGFQLVAALWSDVSNQYFSTAYRIEDSRQFATEYNTRWQQDIEITKSHVATHPPGAVLLFYGARRVYENVPIVSGFFQSFAPAFTGANTQSVTEQVRGILRNATGEEINLPDEAIGSALWCAFLLSLSVALTVPAVFKLAGDTATHEVERDRRGLLAAVLFVLSPTVALFTFTLDAPIAALVAWSLVFFAHRQRTGSIVAAIASGVFLGLAVFISFGALAVWAVLLLALGMLWGGRSLVTSPILVLSDLFARRKAAVHRPFSDFALALLGFVALWTFVLTVLPMPLRAIYSRAMEVHHLATLTSRSHFGWILLNLFVFALFCGWPLTLGVLTAIRGLFAERRAGVLAWDATRALGLAAVLLIVLLSLAGTVRGETERLWLFLVAPLCAWAAKYYAHWDKITVAIIAVLMATQTLVLAGTLAPLVRPY